jgi:hypothetical protein
LHARRFVTLAPRRLALALVLVASTLLARHARAWDDFGHMEVAAVAYQGMNAKARAEAARLLKLNPSYANWIVGAKPADRDRVAFMRAATWADAIKKDPRYTGDPPSSPTAARNIGYADFTRHTYWHYVNRPYSADGTATVPAGVPNLETQLPTLRAALASPETSDDVRSYDLAWLLHLVGDVHMPLHCIARFSAKAPTGDRGGNEVVINGNAQPPICDDPQYCPYGPPDNLHSFWDIVAGSGYAIAPVEAAASKLPKADAKLAKVLDVSAWVDEGFALAKSAVYVPPVGAGNGPFTITPKYQADAYDLARRRIALAGARLANLLNEALGGPR